MMKIDKILYVNRPHGTKISACITLACAIHSKPWRAPFIREACEGNPLILNPFFWRYHCQLNRGTCVRSALKSKKAVIAYLKYTRKADLAFHDVGPTFLNFIQLFCILQFPEHLTVSHVKFDSHKPAWQLEVLTGQSIYNIKFRHSQTGLP